MSASNGVDLPRLRLFITSQTSFGLATVVVPETAQSLPMRLVTGHLALLVKAGLDITGVAAAPVQVALTQND